MTAEYDRVRKEIAKKYSGGSQRIGMILADRILAIKGLEIRAHDQSPPEITAPPGFMSTERKAQNDMLEAGFVKVIPHDVNKLTAEELKAKLPFQILSDGEVIAVVLPMQDVNKLKQNKKSPGELKFSKEKQGKGKLRE